MLKVGLIYLIGGNKRTATREPFAGHFEHLLDMSGELRIYYAPFYVRLSVC